MKTGLLRLPHKLWIRVLMFLSGIVILGMVYIFQRYNLAAVLGYSDQNATFIINRTIRLILNDLACFIIILALFQDKKYLKVAFMVFLLELLVLLPFYMTIKLTTEGNSEISSPLLSQLHRLIVNPTLMILLMGAFVYQRSKKVTRG